MTSKPPMLGESFEMLKQQAREIPEVKEYLESYSSIIGNIVFARRMQLGYTQKTLADMANTTQHRISEIESGKGNVTMKIMNDVFNILRLQDMNPTFGEEAATIITNK